MSDHRIVWKFPLNRNDESAVDIPAGAQILHTDVQGPSEMLMLWALVDPESPKLRRKFQILATGEPTSAEALKHFDHVGTVIVHAGTLVFHVFLEKEAW